MRTSRRVMFSNVVHPCVGHIPIGYSRAQAPPSDWWGSGLVMARAMRMNTKERRYRLRIVTDTKMKHTIYNLKGCIG